MSQIDSLPPLRDVINRHELRAKKELGQNFLLDLNLTARIARIATPLDQSTIIEVGPGPGGLTRGLLAEGAKKVIAIERDERALPALQEIADAYPGRLDVISGDAMEIDYRALADGPTKLVANLPYNIATPLLTGWLHAQFEQPLFESLTLMFQKEVADRICAQPGSKAYGRLSILCGWMTDAHIALNVGPAAFTPPPKVSSAIAHLVPRVLAGAPHIKSIEAVTRAAFGQRRKMLRQSLKALGVELPPLYEAADIKGTERAEELSVDQFVALARAYEALRASN
ncbi:16S rRNA (adenine(1518)-N(6)/adenine(1519)-N(6))-dimethyltransferase RsmA [Maritalea porphyrae]|jgi:16S rRNA (adenine1518-N6/adenine1519-N6)-dimethyltransferase|uniref:16S rRNA (adenine(1518)-N(6)/adenine(1519)-N(6))- dimethyltransferase RsmA n=1 Tax=Maritalea porphyrae TaxID=880732 RepID=UPI0022B01101|nr:16S rRNA (adenine(1518)-N(6)/adenine(1519)-N(6))-dimethyltransferase RsmA [Maritalea porphyrae]MCZ4270961.1 16S rRNA (adenine(1518)-N(6)/adenine(1519)-N(6))-dimethyltransferase RsmA [Maritalea porphyrae]